MSEAENPTTLDTAADRLRRLEAAWNDPEKSRRSLKWLAGDLGIPESTLRRMTRGRRIGLGDPSSRVVGRNGRSFPARIAPPAPPPPSAAPAADPPPPTAAVTVPDPFMPFPPPPHPWDVAPVPTGPTSVAGAGAEPPWSGPERDGPDPPPSADDPAPPILTEWLEARWDFLERIICAERALWPDAAQPVFLSRLHNLDPGFLEASLRAGG